MILCFYVSTLTNSIKISMLWIMIIVLIIIMFSNIGKLLEIQLPAVLVTMYLFGLNFQTELQMNFTNVLTHNLLMPWEKEAGSK